MIRRYSLAVATVAALALVACGGATAAAPDDERKPDDAKRPVVIGHRTAVFNMAAVMRDFHQAKYRVWVLNNKKTEMSQQVLNLRNEYIQLQQEVQRAGGAPRRRAR